MEKMKGRGMSNILLLFLYRKGCHSGGRVDLSFVTILMGLKIPT